MAIKVRKRAKIMKRYNQALHLTQDTNEKVTTLQLDITNESQESARPVDTRLIFILIKLAIAYISYMSVNTVYSIDH